MAVEDSVQQGARAVESKYKNPKHTGERRKPEDKLDDPGTRVCSQGPETEG